MGSGKQKQSLNVRNCKRTGAERQRDRVDVAHLFLHGKTYREIAEHIAATRPYTLSIPQVARDMKAVVEMWREEYLKDVDKIKARELARIDELERAYWDGWEASQKEQTVRETERVSDTLGKPDETGRPLSKNKLYARERAKRIDTQRDGDSAFLKGIQWCIESRLKIFGLYAAKDVNINWRSEAQKAGIDPDQMQNDLVAQFLAAAAKGQDDED
jgi:hypothetical protein